jgi:hypothetical protein
MSNAARPIQRERPFVALRLINTTLIATSFHGTTEKSNRELYYVNE